MYRSWFRSLLMFAWLATGYGVVHVVVSIWLISVMQAIWPSAFPNESIDVTKDGEAIIQSYTNSYYRAVYRRLDGTPITNTIGLNRTFVGMTQVTIHQSAEPKFWHYRIHGFHDFQKPATSWYLVAPPNRSSTAYFVGYDKLSRQKIGYLGINGFSLQEPTVDQSFPATTSQYQAFYGALVAEQNFQYSGQGSEPDSDYLEAQIWPDIDAAVDAVWILSSGTIYEIRLGAGTVRTLISNRPDFHFLTRTGITRDEKILMRLFVRTEAGFVTIDPDTGESEFLPFEAPPSGFSESICQLRDGNRVVVQREISNRRGKQQQVNILWLDNEGRVERRAETMLYGYSSEMFFHPDPARCVSLPIPLASLGAWAISPWLIEHEASKTPTSFDSFWQFFARFPLWLLTSLSIGVVAGWACRRREKDVFGRTGWFWPILVGAVGWFGWMGYFCLRPLPAKLPHGKWMPAQPEPNQTRGTEIFA